MGRGRRGRRPIPKSGSTWVPGAGGAIARWGAEMGSEVKGKKNPAVEPMSRPGGEAGK